MWQRMAVESGILPSAFHFVSIKLVCCLSCCPLRCGPQERNCVPDGALLRRGGISASLATLQPTPEHAAKVLGPLFAGIRTASYRLPSHGAFART
jgi:hypothetical protein